MRRTPEQDIIFIEGCIQDSLYARGRYLDCRYLYVDRVSEELSNILVSMGVQQSNMGVDFRADDHTYLKALDILKLMIEES